LVLLKERKEFHVKYCYQAQNLLYPSQRDGIINVMDSELCTDCNKVSLILLCFANGRAYSNKVKAVSFPEAFEMMIRLR